MRLSTRIAVLTAMTVAGIAGPAVVGPTSATAATNCNFRVSGSNPPGGSARMWCEKGTYKIFVDCVDNNGNSYRSSSGWVNAPNVAVARCSEDAYLSNWGWTVPR